ncbi:MFS transporter [Streptomyces sp. NPDC059459]|uniref:MFS transporter n=1 Tax=Streptomyces sp. NPDC059459 TaxID=3346839 RepID=UPI0036A20F06
MVRSPAASQGQPSPAPALKPSKGAGGGFGARSAVLLLALLWPAQLLTAAGVMTSTAQAEVAQHFHTTQIAWFVLIYTLVGVLLTPFAAKFGDIYGKKRVMLVITAIGLVGDVIAALAPTYELMLIGRGIAAGYAPIAALVFATSREVFPRKQVGPASGIIGGSGAFVAAASPLIAGWLLDSFGFHGVLWFLVLATAIALVLLFAFVPETPRRAADGQFDWPGGLLLGGSVTALIYGIGQGTAWGWTDLRTLGLLAGSGVGLIAFVLVEKRVAHPLLDVRMMSRRSVATVLASSSVLAGSAIAGASVMSVVVALYPRIPGVSDGLGWSATHSAVVGIPTGIMALLAGFTAGWLTGRADPRLPWLIGGTLATLGLILQGLFHHNELQVIAAGMVSGMGLGMVMACTPILLMGAVSPQEQSMTSGMSIMLQGLANAIATQVTFVVLNRNSTVVDGTTFYQDAGYRNAYFALAACAGIGLLVSLLIPKLLRPTEIEAGAAAI